MSKAKATPMSRPAASRIAAAAAPSNGGQITARSFASRADAAVQRAAVKPGKGGKAR